MKTITFNIRKESVSLANLIASLQQAGAIYSIEKDNDSVTITFE